jgi:LmbE family N-acetylglucosaminyl deacetylase
LNVDHCITSKAVLTAARPLPYSPVQEIYAFETPSATEWAFNAIRPPFTPNVFIDITDTLKTKLMAVRQYKSEIRSFPHPRSEKAIRAMAHRWGSVAGLKAAEAFQLIRKVH